MIARTLSLSLFLLVVGITAQAPLALGGKDPVALCRGEDLAGKPTLVQTHGGLRFQFATSENWASFRKDPERWGPQFDGACGRMGPLSGKGDPGRHTVVQGRLFLFASDSCREGFLQEPEKYLSPEPEPFTPDVEALAEGRALVEKAVTAHGGADALDSKDRLILTRDARTHGWAGRTTRSVSRNGDVQRTTLWTPPQGEGEPVERRWIVKADGAFTTTGDGPRTPLGPSAREDVARAAHREPVALLWARHRKDFRAARLEDAEINGKPVHQVRVDFDGLATVLLLDADDGRVRGLRWTGRLGSGITAEVLELFGGFRTYGGVRIPTERTVLFDGSQRPAEEWRSVRLFGK